MRGKLYLKVNPLLREPLSVLAPHWIDLPARRAALPAGYGDPVRKGNAEELRRHGAHLVVNDLGELADQPTPTISRGGTGQ